MKTMVCVAAATLALDAGSKLLAARLLGAATVSLGGFLRLSLTRNTGMALGILQNSRLAGVLLPLAVILCGCLVMRRYVLTPFTSAACGLVLGGFLGNFLERLWRGYVLDMLFFPWLSWFVCNLADVAICFGVAMLLLSLLLRPQDWREKKGERHAE